MQIKTCSEVVTGLWKVTRSVQKQQHVPVSVIADNDAENQRTTVPEHSYLKGFYGSQ